MAVSAPRAAPLVAVLARGIEGRMTMVTHTAGPWALPALDATNRFHVGQVVDGDGATICIAYGTNSETVANARLIAAAPDLLALAHQYRNDLRHPPSADSITRRLAAIDAVLAKVKGE